MTATLSAASGLLPADTAPGELSLSVVVTAMNEVGNLAPTLANVIAAAEPRVSDFEVIVVDDGSTDGTSELADRLAAADPRIRVHHNGRNRGLAYSYRTGLALAAKGHTSWVAGNNIVPRQGLEDLYASLGDADVITTYVVGDGRGVARRAVSRGLTLTVNLAFGLRLRYLTGPCVYHTSDLQSLRTISEGSMIVPEVLIRMVRSGGTRLDLPLTPQPRTSGRTKTFRVANVARVAHSLVRLWWDIQVLDRCFRRRPTPAPGRSTHVGSRR